MTDPTTETARTLLYRYGLPEDVIDGALCLHAQELAAVQRAAIGQTDDPVFYEGEAGWLVNLIEPDSAASAVSLPPADQTKQREAVAYTLLAADGWTWAAGFDPAKSTVWQDYLRKADAVLAALPATTDQTALLPAWEAVYEPGNVSTYLIGYANDQDAATGMAEAWMRSQAEVTGRVEWVDDKQMATGRYDRWFELIERHDDGVDTGPGIVVRRRVAEEVPLSPFYEHPACGFRWHGRDGMDVPMRDGQPACPRCELHRVADETAATETQASDATEPPEDTVRRFARRLFAVERLCSGRPGYHTVTVKALLTAMSEAEDEPAAGARQDGAQTCPAKHGALGRICELRDGHTGMHTGSGPNGAAVWDGDAP
ncbi:hypothetical protein [Streptomyces parvulus]|uniref:hypothetical protein n=1 Tax=Streptomyces parvulus TaxID=146923 RepID=UPI003719591B